jgi:hypothetical protein
MNDGQIKGNWKKILARFKSALWRLTRSKRNENICVHLGQNHYSYCFMPRVKLRVNYSLLI